jgi:hypothetical protein
VHLTDPDRGAELTASQAHLAEPFRIGRLRQADDVNDDIARSSPQLSRAATVSHCIGSCAGHKRQSSTLTPVRRQPVWLKLEGLLRLTQSPWQQRRALCRTRTDDPFLTMTRRAISGDARLPICCKCGVPCFRCSKIQQLPCDLRLPNSFHSGSIPTSSRLAHIARSGAGRRYRVPKTTLVSGSVVTQCGTS